jgi:uncharacterized repeat protein (TIGR03803 family)
MSLLDVCRSLLLGCALLSAALVSAAQAKHYQVLHSFSGSDGASPNGDLVFDGAGNLYGTTVTGGANRRGAIFKLSPAGDFTLLYSFTGGSDGGGPETGLAIDPATGDLYGTNMEYGTYFAGCAFKLTSAGQLVPLHEFNNDTDGSAASATLTRDAQGNFYGTTLQGGTSNGGAIFELTADGGYQLRHTFTGADGAGSSGRLMLHGTDLYGTASGTIFDFNTNGTLTVLYAMTAPPNALSGGVARDRKGDLYGAALAGENGYIYKLSPDGTFSPFYTFTGGADGRFALGEMLFSGKKHELYGATDRGGAHGDNGTIYKLDLKGNFTLLHGFAGAPDDGAEPAGGLVKRNGKLFGTTIRGGSNDMGTIFAVSTK